jgi:hypothetical protein
MPIGRSEARQRLRQGVTTPPRLRRRGGEPPRAIPHCISTDRGENPTPDLVTLSAEKRSLERDMNVIHPGSGCAVGDVTYEDALQRLLCLVPAPTPCRSVDVAACSGSVLAEAVVARRDLPSFDQSAMDGYAISVADAARQKFLPVIWRSAGGDARGRLVTPGAYRIFTGAPLPSGQTASSRKRMSISSKGA